ncbi:MAG TPA: BON domain-containing protein [Gemmatimonadota bacterium]|nr:BON domain-containing protein [Gemmatimonadota bacterium]
MIRPLLAMTVLCLGLSAACGRADDEPIDDAPIAEETIPFVADSVIEREIQTRLEADPRLDVEGVEIDVRSADQEVSLVGQVPSRLEWSIAREIALSAPGVKSVYLDSIVVLSEQQGGPTGAVAPPQT